MVQLAVILAMAANASIGVLLAAGEIFPKPWGYVLAAVNAALVVLINQLPAIQHAATGGAGMRAVPPKDLQPDEHGDFVGD